MQCSNCQTENPETNKFCRKCGTKLILVCPQCRSKILPDDRFCGHCGNQLAVTPAPAQLLESNEGNEIPSPSTESVSFSEGERRHATIVFADLSGYTSMNERLDPEEVEAIMSRIKNEAVRIVERHEGIVNQFVGDEVLALFGIPTANEDDPVRAVKAAFEIHELVRRISPEVEERIGTRLRMHTGISTGLVVTHIRDIRDGSYSITGDSVNIGARLATRAEANEILVSPETHSLVAPYFKTSALESVTVRGKTKPMIPYRVIGESAVQTRFEAARIQGFTAFTGREHELTTLYSCLEKTLAGMGQFVTVLGEAGLGKSRLTYEFRHSLNRSAITVVQGRCQPYGKNIPYFPHINALRRGFNLRDEDTPVELHEKVVSNVLAIDPPLEKYLPVFLHLLSIPSEVYPLPQHLQGQELTTAIQDALAAIFILNSQKQPMVLVFEDWHWVDEASDSALKHIISLIASHPLMVLVVYRPEYSANWGNLSHHTPIILNAINDQNCENIIKSIWNVDHLPKGMVPVIHERTGGNPFFVEEISSELIEGGTIQVSDRQAVLKRTMDNLSLPNTVQAVIRARLDRLDRCARESLRLAESVGDFSVEVTTKYHLGIPLFYSGQIERAVELHREVAKQLSGPATLKRHGLSGVPSVLTRGFLAWGLSELGEFEEAEMYAQQGIELAEHVKNVISTALVYALSGYAYLRHGDLETAKKMLHKANTLGREADLQSILSFVAGSLGDVYLLLGRPDDALPILEEAVEPQNLDSSIISSIHPITVLSEAYRLSGQIAKAILTAEDVLRLFRKSEERCFGAWTLLVMAKIQSENGSDQIEQAKQTYRQARELAEKLKMRPLLAHCSLELGHYHTRRGETEKARSELMKAIDLFRSLGMRFWQPKAEALLSEVS